MSMPPSRVRSRLLGTAAASIDRLVVSAMRAAGRRSSQREESLGFSRKIELLDEVARAYGDPALLEPGGFFVEPAAIDPDLTHVRSWPNGGEVVDASWSSASEPFLMSVRERYLAHAGNQRAHARLFLGSEPRPTIVMIHGYMGGSFSFEEYVWPIAWLDRIGLDSALFVLPYHARRSSGNVGPPQLPGADPRRNNEGFRQAMYDLRAFVRFLRERGAPAVGVTGMSLGGYSTALLSTLEDDLAFVVPIIPLSSIADFARDHDRLGPPAQATALHAAIERANRVISPFSRPARISPDRTLVLAANDDNVTPIQQAARVAAHLGAPLVRVPGGHLLQVGMREGWRELGALLRRLDLSKPR